jgi:hypothetical protein
MNRLLPIVLAGIFVPGLAYSADPAKGRERPVLRGPA